MSSRINHIFFTEAYFVLHAILQLLTITIIKTNWKLFTKEIKKVPGLSKLGLVLREIAEVNKIIFKDVL